MSESADIHAILDGLEGALSTLGLAVEPARLERWGLLVQRAMGGRARTFHRAEHIFDLSRGADALETLAIYFHDLVYLQVDQGLPRHLEEVLAPYLTLVGGEVALRAADPGADPRGALVFRLFAARPGDPLPRVAGANELLSALAAARTLGEALSLGQLAQVAACIEATIPFRAADAQGQGPYARLEARLRAANAELGLGLGEAELVEAMRRAVWVGNKDVANFAHPDVGHFLDNTWKLLPEGNPSLRQAELYSIAEYRTALQKMEGFLSTLQPERVFHSYAGVPDPAAHAARLARCQANLSVATRYLRAKLLAIAHLEALARATGGDVPLELFMGGLQRGHGGRLEDHLPAGGPEAAERDPRVGELLEAGRAGESSFDLRRAPVAAFLYRRLGEPGLARGFAQARALFQGELAPDAFLAAQPGELASTLARAAARVVRTRREPLEALAARLGGQA